MLKQEVGLCLTTRNTKCVCVVVDLVTVLSWHIVSFPLLWVCCLWLFLDFLLHVSWFQPRCPQSTTWLITHSSPTVGSRRGNIMKGLWVKTRTGRDHSRIMVTDKTDLEKKINLICYQSNQSMIMRNKPES